MNPVTFLPAGQELTGTNKRACPTASSAARAPASFVSGSSCLRSLAFLLALFALFAFRPAAADDRQQLKGHLPAVIQRMHLQPTGDLPATNRVDLAIGLPLRDTAALDALLQQIYDPASANYHKYLTVDQFTQRFGPTAQDY